jgi:signal peptidase I
MKANQNLGTVKTTLRRRILSTMLALCLTTAVLVPATAAAASTDAEVPFTQALADAQQVTNLNSGWKVYVSQGESMLPQIDHNSLLLVAKTDFDKLSPGMLVVYRDNAGDLVSHRLISRTNDGWVAKGLNNYREDPGLVTRDNLQGVVFGTMKYAAGSDKLAATDTANRPAVAYAKKY